MKILSCFYTETVVVNLLLPATYHLADQ